MKKTLCALLLSGCATEFMQLSAKTELYVNKVNSPHYAIQKSQEQGEKELIKLAKVSDCEEGWIFHNNKWIECGVSEKESTFNYDRIKLLFSLEDVTAYHIHPSSIYFQLDYQVKKCEKNIEEINEQLEDQSITIDKRIDLIRSLLWETDQRLKTKAALLRSRAFPSELDIYGSIEVNLKSHSVASENGILEYSFKEKPKSYKEMIEFCNEYNNLAILSLFESSISGGKDDTESIDNAISLLNQKKWIKFSFRPSR